ncbi:MAG: hypothetical protein ACYTHM_00740 [Planctomycetota bacterium]|jgi:hypothetical protein
MGKGMFGLLTGVFVSVFAGALAYELLKKTEIGGRVSARLRSAGTAFREGLRSVEVPVQRNR